MNRPEDCAGISDVLPEFLAGRLAAEEEERVRAHLEGCAECRKRANAVSLLQQTPVPAPDPDRWDGFVDGVVDAAGRPHRRAPPRLIAVAAAAALIAGAAITWTLLDGPSSVPGDELEGLAREVSELPAEEAAAWTAGLGDAGWRAGFDISELTEQDLQQLAREVGRT